MTERCMARFCRGVGLGYGKRQGLVLHGRFQARAVRDGTVRGRSHAEEARSGQVVETARFELTGHVEGREAEEGATQERTASSPWQTRFLTFICVMLGVEPWKSKSHKLRK